LVNGLKRYILEITTVITYSAYLFHSYLVNAMPPKLSINQLKAEGPRWSLTLPQ